MEGMFTLLSSKIINIVKFGLGADLNKLYSIVSTNYLFLFSYYSTLPENHITDTETKSSINDNGRFKCTYKI